MWIVRDLLAAEGIDANVATTDGFTALTLATQNNHTEAAAALLGVAGIDTNIALADSGGTALLLAAEKGHITILRGLLATPGLDVNQGIDNGGTALIVASQNGHTDVVKALLGVPGIDVNRKLSWIGATPLTMACQEGHLDIVRALLEVDGIDITPRLETHGDDALAIAQERNNTELTRAMEEAHAAGRNMANTGFNEARLQVCDYTCDYTGASYPEETDYDLESCMLFTTADELEACMAPADVGGVAQCATTHAAATSGHCTVVTFGTRSATMATFVVVAGFIRCLFRLWRTLLQSRRRIASVRRKR